MVIDALLGGLLGLVTALIELFPTDTLDWPAGESLAAALGPAAGWINPILPVYEFTSTLQPLLEIVLPTVIAARFALWCYFMTPAIGGSAVD